MTIKQKHQAERSKWDAIALSKASRLKLVAPGDNFHRYATRTSTMVGVSEFLGDLSDKRVLEVGCGLGELSVLLAKSGARVTAFDLSPMSVAVTRKRSQLNQVGKAINLVVAAGESLPFRDESFDIIFGKAILHHLDVNLGQPEIYRVLKRGGKAVFVEPMGMNPLLNFVRDHVPYPHKNPRGKDSPLTYDEINAWGQGYRYFYFREIQFLSMLERGLGFHKRLKTLRQLDDILLEYFPFLRRYCRYVVIYMIK